MARKYFGTDGVRGRVGQEPMTVEFALRLASAAARVNRPARLGTMARSIAVPRTATARRRQEPGAPLHPAGETTPERGIVATE